MPEYKIYKSPWKAIKLMLMASVIVAVGILMLDNRSTPKFIDWACILFFGLAYPVGLFQLFDRRPQIIINEVGIFDRTIHKDFINWEIIRDAYIGTVHRQKFICLVVDQQFEPSRSKKGLAKEMYGFTKALRFQELNINLIGISVNEKRLAEFILAMREADRSERGKVG